MSTTTTTTTTLTHTLLTTLNKLTTSLLQFYESHYQSPFHTRPLRTIILTLSAGAVPLAVWALLPRVRADYADYLALGPGGTPHNFVGYVCVKVMGAIGRRDGRDVPGPYVDVRKRWGRRGDGKGNADVGSGSGGVGSGDGGYVDGVLKRYAPYGATSFLGLFGETATAQTGTKEASGGGGGGLPPRPGPRPTVPSFIAPQRQTTEVNPATVPRMQHFLRSLADANPNLLEIRPSGLEGCGTAAVWLKAGTGAKDISVPGYMGIAHGEIAHVHGEGSSHLTLSLADAEEAVWKRWAERHRLSGVGKILPWGYLIVYAPRDAGEYEVWKRLVVAACRFVSGAREVALPSSEASL